MRYKIRNGMFETNSSSVHCYIAYKGDLSLEELENEYIGHLIDESDEGEKLEGYIRDNTDLEPIRFPTYDEYIAICGYLLSHWHCLDNYIVNTINRGIISEPPARDVYEKEFGEFFDGCIRVTTSNWFWDESGCIYDIDGVESLKSHPFDFEDEMERKSEQGSDKFGFDVYRLRGLCHKC